MLAHGTLVAIMQGEGMWPMFAFGFGGIFVITQMHGLSWPRRVRGLVLATYCAGVLAVYGPLGWSRLSEVLRVPLIDYAAVFALAGIIGGVIGVLRLLGRSAPGRRTPASRLSCHDRCRAPAAPATGPTKCAGTAVRAAVSVCRQSCTLSCAATATYDFVWYLGRQVSCNVGHLQARHRRAIGRRAANLTSRNCASFCSNAPGSGLRPGETRHPAVHPREAELKLWDSAFFEAPPAV